MNRIHRKICSSERWAQSVAEVLPRELADVDLGKRMLEIGPGFGATTTVLAPMVEELTALEVDPASAARLREQFGSRVEIVTGSGADMPFPDDGFDSVVCFTMLHHVPSKPLQDKLFAEACRVLRPGGVFAGFDSQLSFRFRMLHIGDTMVVVDQRTLPDRLRAAGFTEVRVEREPKSRIHFRARKP
jgi:ubiquinone/menaquinone biosynthesis C-methylase UbiE